MISPTTAPAIQTMIVISKSTKPGQFTAARAFQVPHHCSPTKVPLENVGVGSRTVLRVRPTQRQLIPRFRTKSLQRESQQPCPCSRGCFHKCLERKCCATTGNHSSH